MDMVDKQSLVRILKKLMYEIDASYLVLRAKLLNVRLIIRKVAHPYGDLLFKWPNHTDHGNLTLPTKFIDPVQFVHEFLGGQSGDAWHPLTFLSDEEHSSPS